MDRYERIVALHRRLAAARRPLALAELERALGCSRATVYRDLAFLRDALGAPLEQTEHGLRYAADAGQFELPGLWLSPAELYALLATHQLLSRTEPGVLGDALAPLVERVGKLLDQHGGGRRVALDRVRILRSGRSYDARVFRAVASGVLQRQRLFLAYEARSSGERSEREVSPQRLTFYRDNWYLDAWCHRREGLRSFSLDRIRDARVLDVAAEDLPAEQLDRELASTYGIFSGTPRDLAVVRFSARAARWAAEQHWHSQQQGQWLDDGRYELRLPFGNATELLMDLLRYGPDAEIIAPVALRQMMIAKLRLALDAYEAG